MNKPIILLAIILLLGSCSPNNPILTIGLVADPQYEDRNTVGKRHYRESLWKLEEAINTFNENSVDFVQNLGDIINSGCVSFDSIIPIYDKLDQGISSYHLLGNHDFAIDSAKMPELLSILSMPDHYYSYIKNNWRFIVLNSMDYSYLANPLYQRDISMLDAYYAKTEKKINHYDWNGAIGEKQQAWIKSELNKAEQEDQRVILFAHMPIKPADVEENSWNADEIAKIIESSENVVAFINGHRHKGNYAFENGIHYISMIGMVDTEISSYGILEVYDDKLVLKGYGNQKRIKIDLE
jgi:manganese-dependent ADP-ribose/CDP-alcohol diphosphatase